MVKTSECVVSQLLLHSACALAEHTQWELCRSRVLIEGSGSWDMLRGFAKMRNRDKN